MTNVCWGLKWLLVARGELETVKLYQVASRCCFEINWWCPSIWCGSENLSSQWCKNMSETIFTMTMWLHFGCHFHALEKEMATHSSVLAWRIPGMGEPGGLPSMGSHRIGHDWSDLAAAAYHNYTILICKCILFFNG